MAHPVELSRARISVVLSVNDLITGVESLSIFGGVIRTSGSIKTEFDIGSSKLW